MSNDNERVARAILARITEIGSEVAGRPIQADEFDEMCASQYARAALSALPERELLREALNALEPFANVAAHDIGDDETDRDTFRPFSNPKWASVPLLSVGDLRRARAAADKIRAALEHQQKGEPKP